MKVELTKSQCNNLAEFIEIYLLQSIRDDKEMDNLDYLRDLLDAQKALEKAVEDDG
jgi:hypothetical protein